MDPNDQQPNPLTTAFSDATSTPTEPTEQKASSGLDFIESTLAGLDFEDTTQTPADTQQGSDSSDGDAKTNSPLDDLDDQFPDLDDKATPQAKQRWGELKSELKSERKALAALKQELEGLKQKTLYDPTEVESLKKQLEEYNQELSVHRIEATKEYKTTIDEPLATIGDAAASIARRYEVDQELLFDALAERDEGKQQRLLSDLVDGMSDRDRLKLYQMADDTALLLRKRDEMKSRSMEALQELEIKQQRAEELRVAEYQREFSGHVDKLFQAFETKIPFHPLDEKESKATVLDQLKKDVLAAGQSDHDVDVQAYGVAAGVMLPRLLKQYRAILSENNALKSRLSSTTAASPGRAKQAMAPPTDRPKGFLEAIFAD